MVTSIFKKWQGIWEHVTRHATTPGVLTCAPLVPCSPTEPCWPGPPLLPFETREDVGKGQPSVLQSHLHKGAGRQSQLYQGSEVRAP